jgi:hypothetical protein
MILRRTMNNLRSQNWLGLSLELLVLVSGVFLGLQVDDWNEARKERAEEQVIVESLRVEIGNNIAAYENASERLEKEQQLYVDYYDYLTGTSEARPNEIDLLNVLCRVGLGQETTYDNTIYEELVSTGRTAIISDGALRAALRQYIRLQARREAAFDDVVPVAIEQFAAIQEYLAWRPFTDDGRYGNCGLNFAVFEADERAAHHIAGAQRIAFFYMSGTETVLEALIELRETLEVDYPKAKGASQ